MKPQTTNDDVRPPVSDASRSPVCACGPGRVTFAEVMTLRWRREGSGSGDESPDHSDGEYENEDEDVDPDAVGVVDVLAMTPDADGTISLQAVHDAQRRADATQQSHGGEGLEEAGNRAFAKMPMAQQQNIATAFMGFKDTLASALQELLRTNGPNYVVTKADVDEMMAKMRR